MFIPPELPQRIIAVTPCPTPDPICRIEWVNDVLQAFARITESSSGPVIVRPGVGKLELTGHAPEVLVS